MRHENRTALISFLFVLSGLLGLVYQIVWFKYLSSFLGNTTYAQSIVLATFMGGMAIGASMWGRRADIVKRPLAVYGWLEVAIGIFCALYPLLLYVVHGVFVSVLIDLGWSGESSGVLVAKIVVSMVILLPPTILMGGTLPVLVRTVTERLEHAGKVIAILYALNSLGAVIGSILGGFFFIRLVGLQTTILTAAILSVIIGIVALLMSRIEDPAPVDDTVDETPYSYSHRQGTVATIVAGLSGCAAMILEVTWVRMLIPVLGSSTYSFTIMLVAFISGITLGGIYIARFIDRTRNLMVWLLGSQAAIIVSVVVSLLVYERIPFYMWHASTFLSRTESTYPVFLMLQFIISFLWMFVPTFFFGISLPAAIRIASRSTRTLGTSVGNVYTVNTLGTVVGSILAGFVFIPWLGLYGAVQVSLVVLVCSAIVIIFGDPGSVTVRVRYAISGAIIAGFFGVILFPADTMIPSMTGVFRLINKDRPPPDTFEEYVHRYAPSDILFYKEGPSATVGVAESMTASGPERILIINGKTDASSRGDLPTQLLLGHLPALMHEDPQRALVVGYGSGATVGGLLKHPLERVDCVEISPEVIDASPFFEEVNGNPFDDERFRLYIDDAASFIEVSPVTYDLIVSEPSNPWIAGIGTLYTTEFFEQCKSSLTPNGVMSQWFHLYEVDNETFTLVIRTFASVFPYVTLWESMTADILLIGSMTPIEMTPEILGKRMDRPLVRSDLERIGITDPLTLLSLQVMSNRNVRGYAGDGILNTEDHPVLEFLAPRAFFVNKGVADLDDSDERFLHPSPDTYLMRKVHDAPLKDREIRSMGMFHAIPSQGHPLLGYFFLSDYETRHPEDKDVLTTLAMLAKFTDKPLERIEYLRKRADLGNDDAQAQIEYGWALFEEQLRSGSSLDVGATRVAEDRIRSAISMVNDTVDTYRTRLADLFFATGRYKLAMDQYAHTIQLRESYPRDQYISTDDLYTRLAMCLYETGDKSRALGYALQAANMNPSNDDARTLIMTIWGEGTGSQDDTLSH